MPVDFLRDAFHERPGATAIVHRDAPTTNAALLEAIDTSGALLAEHGIGPGTVVALEADYAPASIALLLALAEARAIAVPLSPAAGARKPTLRALAGATRRIVVEDGGALRVEEGAPAVGHPLYEQLRREGRAGLVLFTSGSSGEPKASVHDWTRLAGKYRTRGRRLTTLLFLLFDHIGGIDTLLQALANGSTVVIPADRSPRAVAEAIARHRVEVLPAAPSFLSLLLLSGVHEGLDFSSLRYITYGAEVMPQQTLDRLAHAFPGVTLLQKYGITEVGSLRSRSKANDSLWVRLGGEGFETRVVDGMLQVKAHSSILGYLNAPSPFTADGWFMTGDMVEVEGEYVRILGRASDLVNVGGQKVYPAEVESVLLELPNVVEASVRGEPHPFTGQIVVATLRLAEPEDPRALEQRAREHCRARLEAYKVPARVLVSSEPLHTLRHKLSRRGA